MTIVETMSVTVTSAAPSLSLTISPTTMQTGQSAAIAVTGSGIPAGTTFSFVNNVSGNVLASYVFNGTALETNYVFLNTGTADIGYLIVIQATVNGQVYVSNEVAVTVEPAVVASSLSLSVSPNVIASGQTAVMAAVLGPAASGYSVKFVREDTGAAVGTGTTDSTGKATASASFTNSGSTPETVVIMAGTVVSGNAVTSNGFGVVVQGITQASNYGLTCTRPGFWACEAGAGSMSEANCNLVYKSKIGTPCR